jgi:O-antigen/teichoic acid export membrane protein
MRLLANSAWNFAGGIVPSVAALLTVPVVVSRLGTEQYGTLTLLTSIVGYFALLDINASTGALKYLAEYHARKDEARTHQLFSLGLAIYLLIGTLGGAAIAIFARQLSTSVFNVPPALQDTSVLALRYGGVAFLFAQLQTYLMSVPQALQRYDISARTEGVFGSLASVSTLLVVLLGGGLVEVMATRAAISAANVVVLSRVATALIPGLRAAWPGRVVARQLVSFSLYSYLTRFATVTYANADRLLVGAYIDMRSLALYTVPFMLANRVFALIYRLGQVIMPEASRLGAGGQLVELRRTYLLSARYLMFLNAAFCCLLVFFGRELLYYWAGAAFGHKASVILALVALAVLFDSFTNLPSLVNDGLGKPANTGVFAFVRSVIAIGAAWVVVRSGDIEAVAWAQLGVSFVMSAAFLAWVHGRVVPASLFDYVRRAILPCVFPLAVALGWALLFADRAPLPLPVAAGCGVLAVVALAAYAWVVVIEPHHRAQLLARLRRAPLAPPLEP